MALTARRPQPSPAPPQRLCGVVVFGEPPPPERLAGFVLVWIALVVLGTDAVTTARRPPRDAEPIPVPEPA